MKGLVVVLAFLALVAIISVVVIMVSKKPPTDLAKALKLHADYTAKAASASRKGQEGVMNVYSEAAKDVWVMVEEAKKPASRRRIGY
jgi:2-C-methyl-D-erythritol 4-phosphate cytidylyltransferase